jgi:hypothetical protein
MPPAYIAVGPKRSGDVYTTSDFALLMTLGHAVSVYGGAADDSLGIGHSDIMRSDHA